MAKIKKTVLAKPDVYSVMRPGGRREMESITADRMKRWADNGNALIASGARIPSPFNHFDSAGHYPHPVVMGDDNNALVDASTGKPIQWDASTNGGYIDSFEYSPEEGLTYIVDAPGSEKDYDSPAGKIMHTAKESSIFVKKTYTDGSGTTWEDVPVHVAHVLYPREKGQPDPKLVESDEAKDAMAFSMSDIVMNTGEIVGTDVNPSANPLAEEENQFATLMALLQANHIVLPEDTVPDTLIERLVIALTQKQASKAEQEQNQANLTTEPDGAQTKAPGVVMSDLSKEKQEALTANEKKLEAFLMSQTSTKRKELEERIKKLVEGGVIGQDRADVLLNEVSSFSMSIDDVNDDGTVGTSVLEARVEDLESVGSAFDRSYEQPNETSVLDPPDLGGPEDDLSDEQYDEILKMSGAFTD